MKLLSVVLMAMAVAGCSIPGTRAASSVASSARSACGLLQYTMPTQITGYAVGEEKDSALQLCTKDPASLITRAAVFSLRQQTQLFAVLEVAELKASANLSDPGFQASVVAQIGQSQMRQIKVGTQTVYSGTGNRELVFAWFKGRLMHVLLTYQIDNPDQLTKDMVALP